MSKLDDETKQTIKENLESWFVFFNRNAPDNKVLDAQDLLQNFHFLHPLNKHGCPLLVNNLCSIYNSRPLACRIHVVESNPSECEKDPIELHQKIVLILEQIYLSKWLKKALYDLASLYPV